MQKIECRKYEGSADGAVRFLLKEQIGDPVLWKCFVQQFRDQIDGTDRDWRGEYWGKTISLSRWL